MHCELGRKCGMCHWHRAVFAEPFRAQEVLDPSPKLKPLI